MVQVYAFGAPRRKKHFFGIVHFKHIRTRYQKRLLVAYLGVQVCAFGATGQKYTFFALCISTTPTIGVQKHCRWHIWCGGVCVRGATPKCTFFGMMHFKQTHTKYPKKMLVTYLVPRYARSGRNAKSHILWHCEFQWGGGGGG